MKQITEDYCSYETAKLLKEKGFPQDYDKYHGLVYNEEDYEDEYEIQRMVLETRQVKAGTLHSYPLGVPEPKCYCPTHQMTLKWLREVYNLHITIKPYITEEGIMYLFEIYKLETEKFTLIKTKTGFEKSELANEAALLYVLKKNLI